MPREDSDLNPMTVGTEVLFDQGRDRVNGCFTKIREWRAALSWGRWLASMS